jgi:hypothetical protein
MRNKEELILTFGKYKNLPYSKVPDKYKVWLLENIKDLKLKHPELMIKVIEQDILTIEKGLIVHQVNCQKVMGAGLAKQIALKYPQVKHDYLAKQEWLLGDVQFVKVAPELVVCNLAGQFEYGKQPKVYTNYNALRIGFSSVRKFALENKVDVFLPYQIGCGLANGIWDIVYSLIDYHLNSNKFDCFICRKIID